MMQAMIFAAGLGTRLRPLTDHCPKALVMLRDRPLVDHVIDRLRAAGCRRIVVNVHHFGEQLAQHLRGQRLPDTEILISDETDRLLDTGGGVRKALSLIDTDEPLLLHNVDILSAAPLDDFLQKAAAAHRHHSCDAALMVSRRASSRALLFDEDMRMTGWKNLQTGEVRSPSPICCRGFAIPDHPSPNTHHPIELAFSGIHVLFPSVYPTLRQWPERFSITDFYIAECRRHCFIGIDTPDGTLIDVGTPQRLAQAERLIVDKSSANKP